MITFAREALAQIRPEMEKLVADHWEEVANDKNSRVLDVDWAVFEALETAGQLWILAVREEGALVGYVAGVIRPHLHSRGTRAAHVDAIYLAPHVRRNDVGVRMLRNADAALAGLADFITWHVKPERDFGPLLRRMGYHFIETIWGRSVDGTGVVS